MEEGEVLCGMLTVHYSPVMCVTHRDNSAGWSVGVTFDWRERRQVVSVSFPDCSNIGGFRPPGGRCGGVWYRQEDFDDWVGAVEYLRVAVDRLLL